MFSTVLMCLVATSLIITVSAEKKYTNQTEVMDDMIDYTFSCMQELGVVPDVCAEMLIKDKDLSDKKYDSCKCLGPCVGKRFGTMNSDTGKWNWARAKELSELMDSDVLKKEYEIIDTTCRDEVNTHCEAGFEIMKCIMNNSPMAKEMSKNFLAAKDSMKDDEEN